MVMHYVIMYGMSGWDGFGQRPVKAVGTFEKTYLLRMMAEKKVWELNEECPNRYHWVEERP